MSCFGHQRRLSSLVLMIMTVLGSLMKTSLKRALLLISGVKGFLVTSCPVSHCYCCIVGVYHVMYHHDVPQSVSCVSNSVTCPIKINTFKP